MELNFAKLEEIIRYGLCHQMSLEKYEEKYDLRKRVIGEENCLKNTILGFGEEMRRENY